MSKVEWTLDNEPLSTSDLRYIDGLKDVQGTFSGRLDMSTGDLELLYPDGVHSIYIYAPRHGNVIQHWFWTLRERLFDIPYPTELLFSGPSEFTMDTKDGNVTVDGTFRWPADE